MSYIVLAVLSAALIRLAIACVYSRRIYGTSEPSADEHVGTAARFLPRDWIGLLSSNTTREDSPASRTPPFDVPRVCQARLPPKRRPDPEPSPAVHGSQEQPIGSGKQDLSPVPINYRARSAGARQTGLFRV